MSRLRFPFRSQQSSNQINGGPVIPLTQKELANADYWNHVDDTIHDKDKGKSKEVERLWGLENFGNTCYCNSVLQALYACQPFREFVESYPDAPPAISPMAPPPGTASLPNVTPSSPIATTRGNPFDNPALTNGAMSTPEKDKGKRGLFGRRPTSQGVPSLATIQQSTPIPSTPTAAVNANLEVPAIPPNPDQAPPSVFETIQTLFAHLSTSAPHQPLPSRKPAKDDAANAQTASLLPALPNGTPPATGPSPSLTTSSGPAGIKLVSPMEPQGPPLLASLPPPSAPRGGGPFQAGSLGRGVVRPEDLLKTVKRENEMFRGMSQQDAHEFLGWVLNKVAEDVQKVDRTLRAEGREVTEAKGHGQTFVQNLFEGVLTNETRCLSCEMTSSRDELFLDLSIDIEQHSSVTACLRQFSASEMLCQKNKFFCDSCCGLQEAEKSMKIKRLPNVLALHLKRFKYQENLGRYTKLFYRVPFPTQLRLPNTSDDSEDPDRLYELFAVVVHIGNGPHHGHYVCLIRSGGRWAMCDDENIEPIDDADIFRYFGDYPSGAGYVLFYQAVDLDLTSLGMKRPPTPEPEPEPEVFVATRPTENLMDIVEGMEVTTATPAPVTSRSPLKLSIPVEPPLSSTPASPIRAPSISSTSTREAPSPIVRSDPPERQPSYSSRNSRDNKEDPSKWYQFNKKPIEPPNPNKRNSMLNPSPNNINNTPTKSPSSTTFGGLGVNIPSTLHGDATGVLRPEPPHSSYRPTNPTSQLGANDVSPTQMSSSVMSTTSASSNRSSNPPINSPPPQTNGLGRKVSTTAAPRDRTVSSSSSMFGSSVGDKLGSSVGEKDEKGKLGRRLSGMSKLTRSGSSFMGFGKKDKDKDKNGIKE